MLLEVERQTDVIESHLAPIAHCERPRNIRHLLDALDGRWYSCSTLPKACFAARSQPGDGWDHEKAGKTFHNMPDAIQELRSDSPCVPGFPNERRSAARLMPEH